VVKLIEGENQKVHITGGQSDALNPKMRNVIPVVKLITCNHDYIMLMDSNMLCPRNYVRDYCNEMIRRGLSAASVYAVGDLQEDTFASRLEQAMLVTFFGKGAVYGECIRLSPLIGKCMTIRKGTLDIVGGLEAVKDFVSEDGVLGLLVAKSTHTVGLLLGHEAPQYLKGGTPESVLSRCERWFAIRRYHVPLVFWIELMFYPLITGMFIHYFLCNTGTSWISVGLIPLAAILATDTYFLKTISEKLGTKGVKWDYLTAFFYVLCVQLFLPVVWYRVAFKDAGSSFNWLNTVYHIDGKTAKYKKL
jgi:hypothetical protein